MAFDFLRLEGGVFAVDDNLQIAGLLVCAWEPNIACSILGGSDAEFGKAGSGCGLELDAVGSKTRREFEGYTEFRRRSRGSAKTDVRLNSGDPPGPVSGLAELGEGVSVLVSDDAAQQNRRSQSPSGHSRPIDPRPDRDRLLAQRLAYDSANRLQSLELIGAFRALEEMRFELVAFRDAELAEVILLDGFERNCIGVIHSHPGWGLHSI